MVLTRMSTKTRKHLLISALAITLIAIFASNAFATSLNITPYIPTSTPNSVLRSQISCGHYPKADGREVNSYFTVVYNGLGFIDYGANNNNIFFHFTKKPSSVVRYDGKPITNDANKIVNATAGSLVILPANNLAYEPNSLFITFDEPNVPGGKVYFKVGFYPNEKDLTVASMDVNRKWAARTSVNTWSGSKPKGRIDGALYSLDTIKVFGSQGLYLPVNELNIDRTSRLRNFDPGANFLQNAQSIVGRNQGSKSTQKLTYVLPDKTGCETISYIEIK